MHHIFLAAGGGGTTPTFSREAIDHAMERMGWSDQASTFWQHINTFGDSADSGSVALLITFFFVAIGVSFFCSVWEAVLLSVTKPYIENLKSSDQEQEKKAGKTLDKLKTHIDRPLISILTLNTIAHTMGSMGVAAQFSKLTGGGVWDTVGGFVMTIAILVASEIIPKNLGARNWKAWAPWVGVCLVWLTRAMKGVVRAIGFFSKGGGHDADTFSKEELTVMAEMGRMSGSLKEDESRILKNLLTLEEATVEDVMTPRVVVFSMKESTTVQEFLDDHVGEPFSRIPLYEDNRDDITGFVLKDDVLIAAARNQYDLTLGEMRRDVGMISELTNLPDAFKLLQNESQHVAIVHDEFGGMNGLVTLEDIMETLLGMEIVDELDTREDLRAYARTQWEKRSRRKGINLMSASEAEYRESIDTSRAG